jgi:hypothetical protein
VGKADIDIRSVIDLGSEVLEEMGLICGIED